MAKGKNAFIIALVAGGLGYGVWRFYSLKNALAQAVVTVSGASDLQIDGQYLFFRLRFNVENPTRKGLVVSKIYGSISQDGKELSKFSSDASAVISIRPDARVNVPLSVRVPILRLTQLLSRNITDLISENKKAFFGSSPLMVAGILRVGSQEIPFRQTVNLKG